MKTVTSKRKEYQNTTFFATLKEIEQIRDQFNSILQSEKDTISFRSEEFDMVVTGDKEKKMFTVTFDCRSSN